jgi:hypothetical protein
VPRRGAGVKARPFGLPAAGLDPGPLSWEELSERRASRIADYTDGDVMDTEEHERYIDWFFDAGERLRRAIDSVAGEISGIGTPEVS